MELLFAASQNGRRRLEWTSRRSVVQTKAFTSALPTTPWELSSVAQLRYSSPVISQLHPATGRRG